MEGQEEVRPIVFKSGKGFGKVDGIRGLYRESSGRWFVRFSCSGIDRQKTIEVNNNPTFSGLERIATTALKALKKEVEGELQKREPSQKVGKKVPVSAIEKGQNLMVDLPCEGWFEDAVRFWMEHR